jgi:hypothetical protein
MQSHTLKTLLLTATLSTLSVYSADALPFRPMRPQALDAIARAVGHCGDPCVVSGNNGGRVIDFEDAADAIRHGAKERLVIDGFCGSSCMTMAAFARPRTCITERAVFAYHKTNRNRPIPLSSDLQRWILARGGFPESGATPGIMPNQAARKFWPLCGSARAGRRHPSSI